MGLLYDLVDNSDEKDDLINYRVSTSDEIYVNGKDEIVLNRHEIYTDGIVMAISEKNAVHKNRRTNFHEYIVKNPNYIINVYYSKEPLIEEDLSVYDVDLKTFSNIDKDKLKEINNILKNLGLNRRKILMKRIKR